MGHCSETQLQVRENLNYLIYCFKGKMQFCNDSSSSVPLSHFSFFASRDTADKSPYVLFGTHSSRKYISEGSSAVSSDLIISQAGVNQKPATHMVSVTKKRPHTWLLSQVLYRYLKTLKVIEFYKKNYKKLFMALKVLAKRYMIHHTVTWVGP